MAVSRCHAPLALHLERQRKRPSCITELAGDCGNQSINVQGVADSFPHSFRRLTGAPRKPAEP
jgi:hypothetical protein